MHMPRERSKALIASALMHVLLFLILFVGMPELFPRRNPPEPLVLTVDILPITEITNVKSAEAPPAPKQKEEKKQPAAKKETPHVTTAAAPPPPPPPKEPTPAPPKPEVKKEEVKKPEEKKEKKPKEDDLLAVLKAVQKEAAKEQAKTPEKAKEATSPSRNHSEVPYNPNIPIGQTVRDSIRGQLYKCWSLNAGAKDAHTLIVVIKLWLNRDGSLIDAQYTDETKRKMADPTYRAAAEAANRAVHICSPLKELPADKYEGWSFMEFTFDPSQMLY